MICRNCGKEIGMRPECNYCGFDPQKDTLTGPMPKTDPMCYIPPEPVNIRVKEISNGKAKVGFVFSFFSIIPIFCLLSFIFCGIGLSRSGYYHSGRGKAIAGLVLDVLACIFWVIVFKSLLGNG